MSRATRELNATFASSQSFKKREILSPSPYNPMTCNASLPTLSSREPLEHALSSSDQASSPTLDCLGSPFHIRPQDQGHGRPSPCLPSSAIKCKAISAHFLRTSAEKEGVRMSALKKGLKVSLPGTVAGSFLIRKKKGLAVRPVLPWHIPLDGRCA